MQNILEIKNAKKVYSNGTVALDHFSFSLEPGIYGLLGPNGAGKSTLMQALTQNLALSSGEIFYEGKEINHLGAVYRSKVGYMPQQQRAFENFTAVQFLWYMAALKGLERLKAKKQIPYLLQRLNLEKEKKHLIRALSGGMKQRLLLAQALLGDPDILILDEPTAGLDPMERLRIRNIVSESAGKKIVLLATHVVTDIEYIAQNVILMDKGSILRQGKPEDIISELEGRVSEVHLFEENVDSFTKQHLVVNIRRESDGIWARVIEDTPPDGFTCRKTSATLEDVYLYFFNRGQQIEAE